MDDYVVTGVANTRGLMGLNELKMNLADNLKILSLYMHLSE